MLKSQRGVTFLVCVITVIVLLIIGGAVSNTGITMYKNAKVKVFTSEMKMIQEKLNLYNDRAQLDSSLDISMIGCSVLDEEQESCDIEQSCGTIIKADSKDGLLIKTGNGILSIIEIQAPNMKRMEIKEFLRGHTL